ncbi:MAG: SIS domain-containing protein [Ignavibacteria bacterium]|nr:SIS domain-containing protein [Ignavibacteria bacterium]
MENFIENYFKEAIEVINKIDKRQVSKVINIIKEIKNKNGRLFILGVGGSAANASHAVNDFRKIAGIESYTPTDNVSELTARINDNGWESVFVDWLKISKLNENDCLFILSVGGGNLEKNVSVNLIESIKYAKNKNAKVIGIVGRDGGYTGKEADACIIIPTVNEKSVTPHTEAFQAIVWHLIVSHPDIQQYEMKWESIK